MRTGAEVHANMVSEYPVVLTAAQPTSDHDNLPGNVAIDNLKGPRFGVLRRLLRDIAAGKEVTQDTTTLEDFSLLAKLRESDE